MRALSFYSRTQPQYFWPAAIAFTLVPGFAVLTSFRRRFLFADAAVVPTEYPLPKRERVPLSGYDDE
ncbi:hypothetical protein V1512DRAFT_249596 [Lipomyces arxii]|uniref:uncharacterized protein n=1 Tax=Lipomyces arxii TaxID=56418 RepID=UPI0034CD3427